MIVWISSASESVCSLPLDLNSMSSSAEPLAVAVQSIVVLRSVGKTDGMGVFAALSMLNDANATVSFASNAQRGDALYDWYQFQRTDDGAVSWQCFGREQVYAEYAEVLLPFGIVMRRDDASPDRLRISKLPAPSSDAESSK